MKYLELVESNQVLLAILQELQGHDIYVIKATAQSVTVKTNCLPVTISWEVCSCHGGRMWFNQEETGISESLYSTAYDTDKGIVDPYTELAYYIEHDMYNILMNFSKYVYIVTVVDKYKKGGKEIRYFKSVEDASNYIFEEEGHDVNSTYEKVIHKYPNPDIYTEIKYIQDEGDRIQFEHCRFERCGESDHFKVVDSYMLYYSVFRK